MRLALAASPIASSPLTPAGLGVSHVPEASITASARKRRGSLAVLVADFEGGVFPARRLDLVEPNAAHRNNPRVGLDVLAELRAGGERLKILRNELAACWIPLRLRAVPTFLAATAPPTPCRRCRTRGKTCARATIAALQWPTLSPASSTTGFRPRPRACAAAASPTGPPPMIATVFFGLGIPSILPVASKLRANHLGSRVGLLSDRGAVGFRAALATRNSTRPRIIG